MESILPATSTWGHGTRQFILNSFPEYAFTDQSDTCTYINSINHGTCGAPTMTEDDGTRVPVCELHYAVYSSAKMIYEEELVNEQVLPTLARIPSAIPVFEEPAQDEHIDMRLFTSGGARTGEERISSRARRPITLSTPKFSYESFPLHIDPSSECSVCMAGEKLLSLTCRHVACVSCYNELRVKTCPVCRANIIHTFVRRLK